MAEPLVLINTSAASFLLRGRGGVWQHFDIWSETILSHPTARYQIQSCLQPFFRSRHHGEFCFIVPPWHIMVSEVSALNILSWFLVKKRKHF